MNASSFKVNPILTERVIQLLSILLAMYVLYYLYTSFESIRYIYSEPSAVGLYEIANVIFYVVIFPTTVFFFWRRRKIGWILLVFQQVSGLVTLAITFLVFKYIEYDSFIHTEVRLSTHPAFFVAGTVFLLVVLLKPIREHYSINIITMLLSIAGGIVAAILWSIPIMQDFRVFEIYQMRNSL